MAPSAGDLENINPKLYKRTKDRAVTAEEEDDSVHDEFDSREIFGNRFFFIPLCCCYSLLNSVV